MRGERRSREGAEPPCGGSGVAVRGAEPPIVPAAAGTPLLDIRTLFRHAIL